MESLIDDRLRAARAAIASRHAASRVDARLGSITLHEHQRVAVARVGARLDAYNGCLLAEEVGRGKTFVALAAARRWRAPLVVLPAALRDTWRTAMTRAGVDHPLLSHEELSRGHRPPFHPDGAIVDESHHFRNSATRRYGALADLCARSEMLLLSATPVQNGVRDLRAQLALFLGSAVSHMTDAELALHIVRSTDGGTQEGLPEIAPPQWVSPDVDDAEVLRAILDLPSPPRALDAGDAGALRTLGLVRAWASSRAALVSALGTRRRTVTAIEQSLDAGRIPSKAELSTWSGAGDDCIQLGFAELLVGAATGPASLELAHAVKAEHDALDRLSALLRAMPEVDSVRADCVRRIARDHAGERVIAFAGLASTARAYFAALRTDAEVAMLTAGEARIASGRISRRALLARFAPDAQGVAPPAARERIGLLVSTDLLSEGVNLQDASVVIHLDIPWNPARLAQRVGRIRRPSSARRVSAYLLAPPAGTELLVEIEGRLRRKLAVAESAIGRGLAVMPALTLRGMEQAASTSSGLVDAAARVQARIASWEVRGAGSDRDTLTCAGVSSDATGWLAMLSDGRLLGSLDAGVHADAHLIDALTARCEGAAREIGIPELESVMTALERHLASEHLLADCGATAVRSPAADAVERHAVRLLRPCCRTQRRAQLERLSMLRTALNGPLSLGTERALTRLLEASRRPCGDFTAAALALLGPVPPRSVRSIAATPLVIILIG